MYLRRFVRILWSFQTKIWTFWSQISCWTAPASIWLFHLNHTSIRTPHSVPLMGNSWQKGRDTLPHCHIVGDHLHAVHHWEYKSSSLNMCSCSVPCRNSRMSYSLSHSPKQIQHSYSNTIFVQLLADWRVRFQHIFWVMVFQMLGAFFKDYYSVYRGH